MKEYKNTNDNVHGAIERRLRDEGFQVKHLYRDAREDWGDDGGYLISVSVKNDQYYLHILEVNYNCTVGIHVLEESDKRLKDGSCNILEHKDYIICDSTQEVQKELERLVKYLDLAIQLEEQGSYFFCSGYFDEENDESLPEELRKLQMYYKKIIGVCTFSYSEFRHVDKPAILNLLNTKYVPNYLDPEEYREDD